MKVQQWDTNWGVGEMWGGVVKMRVRVWNEGRLSTQMENGPVALTLHTAAR